MGWSGTAPSQSFSRTDGSRTGSTVWQQAAAADVDIVADDHDTHDEDLASGINACLKKDGGNQPTANLPMNSNKHTGVAAASSRTDYADSGSVADGDMDWVGNLSGTNTYTASSNNFAPAAYVQGMQVRVRVVNANTGAATFNYNSIGAKDIVKNGDVALSSGDLVAGGIYTLTYDSNWDAWVVADWFAGDYNDLTNTPTIVGQQTIWVPAVAMTSRTTNGAASGTAETSTHKVMVSTLDFDASTDEFAQFAIQMPKGWNEGTLVCQAVWTHGSTTTNFDVTWAIQAVALSNDDGLDSAFGTAVTMKDTGGTTDDVYISPESSAMTVAGTPSAEEYVIFQVYRDVDGAGTSGDDDLAVDAKLLGVKIHYTTTANTDD